MEPTTNHKPTVLMVEDEEDTASLLKFCWSGRVMQSSMPKTAGRHRNSRIRWRPRILSYWM